MRFHSSGGMAMSSKTVTALRVIEGFRGGSSLPVLVDTEEGERVVIKWKCTAEGPSAIATDWMCLQIARRSGIDVPDPVMILVTPSLARRGMDPDITDLIDRSVGLNLGLAYLPDSRVFRSDDRQLLPIEQQERIFLLDLLLLNIDRTEKNPNMLVHEKSVYCIDFSAAMNIKMLVENTALNVAPLITLLRRHPFYTPNPDIDAFAASARGLPAEGLLQEIPEEWLARNNHGRIQTGLQQLFADMKKTITERLLPLASVAVESEREFAERAMKNRLAFEATVKRLSEK